MALAVFGGAPPLPHGPQPPLPGEPSPPNVLGALPPGTLLPGTLPPGVLPPGALPPGMVPTGPPPDRRSLWLGAPGADDKGRSKDEVRVIKEMCCEEVEMFLFANNIDTAAAKELRNEPPHIALAVLERGSLRACTNPSGALVARIRDAKRGILSGTARYGAPAQPLSSLDPAASETERFLATNLIDQAGAASFRSEMLEVQKAVMAKGPLVNTSNPSASLMARIRTVKQNGGPGAPGAAPGAGAMPGMGAPPLGIQLPAPAGGPGIIPILAQAPSGMFGLPGQPGPPMQALPAPAVDTGAVAAPQLSPAEAARTSAAISDDVQKAIERLKAGGAPPPHAVAMPAQTSTNAGMANAEDTKLQAEALKAIQELNMSMGGVDAADL